MVPVSNVVCPLPSCRRGFKNIMGLRVHMTKTHTTEEVDSAINANIQQALSGATSASATSGSHPQITQAPINNTSQSTAVTTKLLSEHLQSLRSNVRIFKRLPKASRLLVAQEFSRTIDMCNKNINSHIHWTRLLTFPYVVFKRPDKSDKASSKVSLATIVKRNIVLWNRIRDLEYNDYMEAILPTTIKSKKVKKGLCSDSMRIKKVQSKLNEGDFKGAIRILSSDDSIAPFKVDTYLRLLEKHPQPSIPMNMTEPPIHNISPVLESEVKVAIFRFANGSAGGIDGLRPQHLKDMLNKENGDHANKLLRVLCVFAENLLNAKAHEFIIPILYGATLCALKKKDASLRPIAIGCTLRRLVSKIAGARVYEKLGSDFRPVQLGFGTPGGAEAGAHAARRFINFNHASPKVFLKLDYKNAFNELERNPMLISALEMCPEIYPYVKQCYSTPSILWYGGDYVISSQRGCQQGDPLGPPLFCMAIHEMTRSLGSELNIWYLDDGSLGGDPDVVFDDFQKIIQKSVDLGLTLNFRKCELLVIGSENQQELYNTFAEIAPGLILRETEINLLGAPMTNSGISVEIGSKLRELQLMVSRLNDMNSHQAFFLLRHSLSIPKMMFLLRTTPCWRSIEVLIEYDNMLKSALERIVNCSLDGNAWKQATISVKYGGLGLRDVTKLCFSSFLGSSHSVTDLLNAILPSVVSQTPDSAVSEASQLWQSITQTELIPLPSRKLQSNWDDPICTKLQEELLLGESTDVGRARLLAGASKEAGAWLTAFPAASLGNLLDDHSFRIAVGLRLGAPLCHPHLCICGEKVDESGIHGLCCKKSAGRKATHEMVNDLVKRALTSCGVPAIREPEGCNRSDGKRPDGLTLIPWKYGKSLVWDFTCADTLCKSYVKSTSRRAGRAANLRENAKRLKYASLEDRFIFVPIAIESMGSWGQDGQKLIEMIGDKLVEVTGEQRSKHYLYQRISIAIQRGNAASILGTLPHSTERLDSIYYMI